LNGPNFSYLAWLFLSQSLAASDFADLVALVVTTGSALAAIVLLLTAETLATTFSLFLVRLVVVKAHAGGRLLRPEPVPGFAVAVAIPDPVTRGGWREQDSG